MQTRWITPSPVAAVWVDEGTTATHISSTSGSHGAGPKSGNHHQPVSSPNLIASWIFIRANIQMNAGKANARITPRMA